MATPEIFTTDVSYREEDFSSSGFANGFEAADDQWAHTVPTDLPIASLRYRVLKPILDLLVVFLSLPIIVPLGLLVAAIIRLTSKGPVLYRHQRIGQFRQPIYVWKFRTMYENSDFLLEQHLSASPAARREWARSQKLRKDPRVTPVGRLLRKTSMDEIPQFINVLAGEMSVVGPRPIVENERTKYGRYFPTYCCALPGITGLWQVSGRCEIDYPERVLLDVQYIERWSLRMELRILLKTVYVILRSKGAY